MILSKEIVTLFQAFFTCSYIMQDFKPLVIIIFFFVIVFAKILSLFIIQLYNISPFKKKYFQLSRNLVWVTKYILMIIITLICVEKMLLFSNYQMGVVGALKICYTTSKNLQGICNQ
jgi:SNF family Na+-dependent transporter